MFVETQGLWDVVVKQFGSTLLGVIVFIRQSLSIETCNKLCSFLIIITSSPASGLLWLCSVNILANRKLLMGFGY